MDDDDIRTLVTRLSRPHPSGGKVVERAAILAEGTDSSAILRWIVAHGEAEDLAPVAAGSGGLHSARGHDSGATKAPLRYVLPPGALSTTQ